MTNDSRRFWVVRAGEGGTLAKDFEAKNCVAIGWPEAGDFTPLSTPAAVRERIEKSYSTKSGGTRFSHFGQTNKFRNVMRVGDRVATYDGDRKEYIIGTVTGDYAYREELIPGFNNVRAVTWDGRVPKDALLKSTRKALEWRKTVFERPNTVLNDVEEALKTGRKAPPSSEQKLDLEALFSEFESDYLDADVGRKHAASYRPSVQSGSENYEQIRKADARGEDVTELVLTKLLPHTNTTRHREQGEWIHIAPAVTKDVRSWFEGAGWATPADWPQKAKLILNLVRSAVEHPERLQDACSAFASSSLSKGLQCGMLTPILNALRPDEYAIINSKVEKTYDTITGDDIDTSMESYPESNRRILDFVSSNSALFERAAKYGLAPLHGFDMFCHWFVAVRDTVEPPIIGPNKVDRISSESARQVLERICPDGAPRTAVLEQLARSILVAHELAPRAWSVTLKRHFVRLNVGGMMALDIEEEGLSIVLHEPSVQAENRVQIESFAQDEFKYLEGAGWFLIPFDSLDPALGVVRLAHEEVIRRIVQKSEEAPFRKAHSPGVLKYLREIGHAVPDPAYHGDEKPPPDPDPAEGVHPLYSFEHAQTDTNIPAAQLERWIKAINRKGQAILYGPPGTGKTFVAERLARILLSGGTGHRDFVQFHSAYAYEDFIQGIRPESKNGSVSFEMTPGRFMEFCAAAEGRSGTSVLIIDEINRANLSNVFGELMYLLEYRDREIPLAGGGRLRIPPGVRIIGTMNTADRSIALVDHALRRRFAFLRLDPDLELLARYHEQSGRDVDGLVEVLRQLNERIDDPHYSVGISFFMRESLADDLEAIWTGEIEPYIEELFFDRQAEADRFRWSEIRDRAAVSVEA